MNTEELETTAKAMVAPGKGVLAMDESNASCTKRFQAVGLACTEESRRAYRDMFGDDRRVVGVHHRCHPFR